MTGAEIIVNQINLNDNNSMFRNTVTIDNAIVKRKGSQICQYGDCEKTPSYNYVGKTKRLYCKLHAELGMVNVKNPRCKHPECKIKPCYNKEGERKGLYCKEHATPDMVDVVSPKCKHPECKCRPNFNKKGERKGLYCKEHATPDMVNVVSPRCKHPECKCRPNFNKAGESKGLYCKEHAKPGMVDVVNPKCKHPSCDKQPNYNKEGESKGLYCKDHKKPGMIDVKSQRCKHPSCDKQPNYNKEGESKGLYCKDHKKPGMIDVKSQRCKTPLCDTFVNKKYKGYCLRCFIHTFPDEPVTRNYKTKEKAVADRITEKFSDMTWTLDKTVEGGCSRKRPDLLCDMGPYILIVEIDEDKHVNYSCENKRMMELFQDVGNRPIVFIRFNPDSYKNKEGKRITSCWRANKLGIMSVVKSKEKEWENRLKDLFEKIEYWSKNEPSKTITVEQLFYDELDDE